MTYYLVMDAFSNSEFTYWWGPIEVMRSWHEERIQRRFVNPNTQQFKVVDDKTGVIVAWAKWDPPARMAGLREGFTVYDEAGQPVSTSDNLKSQSEDEGEEDTGESLALGAPAGSDVELFKEFFDGLVSMENKYQASERLVLTHLCTRRSYHGRGLGAALLYPVLEIADKEGLTAYLEATQAGLKLYQNLGFETVDKLEFHHSKPRIRTPTTLQCVLPSLLPYTPLVACSLNDYVEGAAGTVIYYALEGLLG
ncbi:hypothetical protein NPX13_g9671 [Xylaria arbuscula]|uniref:N-acetyltransferase domain-containing protein n=1 Tax=Xylaria arbuscula TaxID=114810 RepID=A0A9W8N6A2_9PEZI|nr:hypothetical protein NPX13_g9671 [Xylaria arbuscula]